MSRYFIFAVVSLSLLLISISGTAISVAFPVITSSFDTSLILAGWVLSIYQLVGTVSMPLAGKAGDLFGRKRTFLISLSFFIIGSLMCALAPNIEFLIVSRFIQGIGSGSFLPLAAGIVAEEFPKSRQQAIGFFSSIFPIGHIIGPNLGGWMTASFGWRSIFWLNIPLAFIALLASALLLRASGKEQGHMDLTGTGLFAGSLFALMVGLSGLGTSSERSSWLFSGMLFIAAIILMLLFLRHEARSQNPIIDMQLLRERPFLAANIFNFMYGACAFGIMSLIPLYAVSVYGLSILESGIILTPRSVGLIISSSVTSFSLPRWGYRRPILLGTAIVAVCLFLLGIELQGVNISGIHLSNTVLLVIVMLVAGVGMGTVNPAANNACIELMPQRVATITGVRGMFRQSGGAISIAVASLMLHNITDISHGFTFVFYGLAAVMIISIPLIFAMPKAAQTASPIRK